MNEIKQDECIIERVIVHVLDNSQPEPVFTDFEVTLPPKHEKLLRSHISVSLQSSIPNRFDNRNTNGVCLACEAAFSNAEDEFVATSKKLTAALFPLMRKQSINAGTLWAVLFRKESAEDASHNNTLKYLALLKMDDKSSLTWRQEVAEDGKRRLHLDGNDHTVPQAEVKLDKAAFVFPQAILPDGKPIFEYDLRVLDRKRSRGNVADFFTDFLGCSAAFEAKRGTQRFINTIDNLTSKLLEETSQKALKLREKGDEEEAAEEELKIQSTVQDLQFTKTLFLSNHDEVENEEYVKAALGDNEPGIKERVVKALRQSIGSDSFHVDEDTKRKFKQRALWKLSKGSNRIDIRGSREAFEAMVDTSKYKTDNVITIHVNDIKMLV